MRYSEQKSIDYQKRQSERQLCDYFQVNLSFLLGEDVDRALVLPSDEDLNRWDEEDETQIAIGVVRRFLKLSPDMQDVVKQTLLAAYQFDKKRGALQNINKEQIKKLVDDTYWKKLDED